MKSLILTFVLFNSILTFANDNVDKILNSKDIQTTISDTETNKKVDCMTVKEHQIHWMCTNNQCGFVLDVFCASRIGKTETNDHYFKLNISGKISDKGVLTVNDETTYSRVEEIHSQTLMNAIANCPKESNPLKALKDMGGNSFGYVKTKFGKMIEVEAISNPKLLNPLIMAPVRLIGYIRVSMSYPAPKQSLKCDLTKF